VSIDRDAIQLHQVHPVKLAFDITASVVSNFLLWQHRLGDGLVWRYLPPVVGSALVLGFADVDRLRDTRRGRYVLEHMSPASTALRLAGDTLMAVGAWRRQTSWLLAGALIVAAGWSHGAFFDPISTDR
jgi:hypothetical protein